MKLQLQKSRDWLVQNRYYNGWKGTTFVNLVFVFAPDGCIRICALSMNPEHSMTVQWLNMVLWQMTREWTTEGKQLRC